MNPDNGDVEFIYVLGSTAGGYDKGNTISYVYGKNKFILICTWGSVKSQTIMIFLDNNGLFEYAAYVESDENVNAHDDKNSVVLSTSTNNSFIASSQTTSFSCGYDTTHPLLMRIDCNTN